MASAGVEELRRRQLLAAPKKDVFTRHGELIRSVAEEPDGVERMVGVVRLALALTSDILRPSADFKNTPVPMLGQHYLARRELPGDLTCRFQEIATFLEEPCESLPYPYQGKNYGSGPPVAVLELLRLTPDAKTKAKLLGNSARLEVRFEGVCRLTLPRLGEVYNITLPALTLTDPLSRSAVIDFTGQATVKCVGGTTVAVVNFKPRSAVKGEIDVIRHRGTGSKVYSIRGNWDGVVTCTPRGEAGAEEFVIFDCNSYCPPAPGDEEEGLGGVLKFIDLNNIGPMELSRLWSAIHDAIIDIDGRKKSGGKAAGKLNRALSEGVGSLSLDNSFPQPRPTSLNAGAEKSRAALPPCIKQLRAKGLKLKYTLAYWLCAPPEDSPPDPGAPSTSGL